MGLSWSVMGVSVVLVVLSGFCLLWQILRRREAVAALLSYQAHLELRLATANQQESEVHELTAGLRAEKAHVAQLQRQVEFAQDEVVRVSAEHSQLVMQHDELKQTHSRLQQVHAVLQGKLVNPIESEPELDFGRQIARCEMQVALNRSNRG